MAFILATETTIGDAIRALLLTVIPILLLLLSSLAAFIMGIWTADGRLNLRSLGIGVASIASSLGYWYLTGGLQGQYGWAGSLLVAAGLPLFLWYLARHIQAVRMALRTLRTGQALAWFVQGISSTDQTVQVAKGIYSISVLLMVAAVPLSGLLALVSSLGESTFWLPRERLVFQNEAPFTGYVPKVSEDQLMILNDKPRMIIQKDKDTLRDRDFCYPKDHKARSSKLAADSPACP